MPRKILTTENAKGASAERANCARRVITLISGVLIKIAGIERKQALARLHPLRRLISPTDLDY
jgi:hypothetical protein